MRRIIGAVTAVVLVGAAAVGSQALAGGSDGSAQVVAGAGVKSVPVLTLARAQRLADAAVLDCRRRGYAVTATVVDRDGVALATLRDEDATGATVAVALGKAVAAAGFRSPSGALGDAARSTPGLLTVPDFVLLPGGQPLATADGQALGGIGVSGAPSGDIDDACVAAAIAAG